MATFEVFKLQPRGAFHFGTPGVGIEATIERCPSDTLYGAMLLEAGQAGMPFPTPAPDGTLAEPRFRLSSCFPYAGDTLLFPTPRLAPTQRAEPQPGQRKRTKNIRYVSPTILRDLLTGASLLDWTPDEHGQGRGRLYQDGAVLIAGEETPQFERRNGVRDDTRLWSVDRVDHVTVDRLSQASAYYAVGQVRFAGGCGLYVLAQVRDGAVGDQLFDLLTRLGHTGLGGRRSHGLGQFDVQRTGTITLPDGDGSERVMLLSRYLPAPGELEKGVLSAGAAYDLQRVGGWLQSPAAPSRLRKTIHLLAEGSVVRCIDGRSPQGRVVDVRPDGDLVPHPVWRYGLALTAGVSLQEEV